MLSLQNSTTVAQHLRVSIAARTIVRTSAVLTRRPRTQEQSRNFRFGLWSSYLDRNYEKELRRRHRTVKHKYIEALNRKLSWDRHLPVHPKAYGFKNFMCSAWHNQDPRPGGRWVNVDAMRTPREETVTQENEPRDWRDLHLRIQRFKASFNESVRVGSDAPDNDPLRHVRMRVDLKPESTLNSGKIPSRSEIYHERLRRRFQAQEAPKESAYKIDPITNRKVYITTLKENAGEPEFNWKDIPAQTFRFYRSQFQRPGSAQGDKASQSPQGVAPTTKASDSTQASLREYDAKVNYYSQGVLYNVLGCGIDYTDAVQAGLKDHDEKIAKLTPQVDFSRGVRENHAPNDKAAADNKEAQDDAQRAIHHYEATVVRPKGLLKAIREYESKRPIFPEGLVEKDVQANPLIQAIQEYERGKVSSEHSNSKDRMLDPLLKSIHEYQKKLALDKIIVERSGGVVDAKLADVLTPIEEYRRSLSQARYRAESIDGLNDYDAKVDYSRGRRDSILRLAGEEKTEDLDLLRASDIRAASGKLKKPRMESEVEKSAKRKELENAFRASQDDLRPSEDESAAFERVKEIRKKPYASNIVSEDGTEFTSSATSGHRKLTGNFVRDFPEEFQTAWQKHDSGTLIPKSNAVQASLRPGFPADTTEIGQQPGNPNALRLETSLDRAVQSTSQLPASNTEVAASLSAEPSAPTPVALDSQNMAKIEDQDEDALTRDVRNIYEKKYGIIDSEHRHLPQFSTAQTVPVEITPEPIRPKIEPLEPTLYKILAYNPTMQSISEAETTSIVEDSATPLTPAEVLLRLSNPAKFFPHFLPLQSQGYEIVSGSGDVLVFRKVRSASAPSSELPAQARSTSNEIHRRTITNPIDGMQRNAYTATGDFASPTGFVNHDLPRGSDPPYNVDVRREEPVFSGKSSWQGKSEEKPRRKGRGRKVLISAVWVAGCCYAVGVVTEFFRGGGPNGLQGF